MDTSRLKTIAIIILILTNICLCGLYVFDVYSKAEREAEERRELLSYLRQNGIEIEEEAVSLNVQAGGYTLARDRARERELAELLFGEVSVEEKGGNIVDYRSEKGTASFSDSGFELRIYGYDDAERGPNDLSSELFSKMNFSVKMDSEELQQDGNKRLAAYTCLFGGNEIYNCRVSVVYDGDAVVSGYRLTVFAQYSTSEKLMSATTALVHFLNEIRTSGSICSKIYTAEVGYMMSVTRSVCRLEPVWRIVTDGGNYYLDGVSGKLLTALS